MASSFTWLDYSEHQRRRMLEIVDLFKEPGTVDELGIGTVRDALADTLFPATSTLHTRPRYLFFVPWIYQRIERARVPSTQVAARLRQDELRLIAALERGGEREGVIGIEARQRLRRFPSVVYWSALTKLGIRLAPGSQRHYHRSLESFYARERGTLRTDDGEPTGAGLGANWHPGLPTPPHELLEETTFDLIDGEAEFLRERVLHTARDSCLAFLVSADPSHGPAGDLPWDEPGLAEAPGTVRAQVEHARCFSEVMHGAALLYNLILAEKVTDGRNIADTDPAVRDDLVADYRSQMQTWSELVDRHVSRFQTWDRPAFWQLVARRNRRISTRTRQFIDAWIDLAVRWGGDVTHDDDARQLVRNREVQVKRGLARVANPRALERWNGASGTQQLGFRWPQAVTLVADIRKGLHLDLRGSRARA